MNYKILLLSTLLATQINYTTNDASANQTNTDAEKTTSINAIQEIISHAQTEKKSEETLHINADAGELAIQTDANNTENANQTNTPEAQVLEKIKPARQCSEVALDKLKIFLSQECNKKQINTTHKEVKDAYLESFNQCWKDLFESEK
jgi:hypothetical protein